MFRTGQGGCAVAAMSGRATSEIGRILRITDEADFADNCSFEFHRLSSAMSTLSSDDQRRTSPTSLVAVDITSTACSIGGGSRYARNVRLVSWRSSRAGYPAIDVFMLMRHFSTAGPRRWRTF